MDLDPRVPKYQNSDPLSFAHSSVRTRWPAIITGVIDDVHRAISNTPATSESKIAAGKKLVADIATLKYELQHNRRLSPLPDDGGSDIGLYNAELATREQQQSPAGEVRWHATEWLYSECYLYRRLAGLFRLAGPDWRGYDYFQRQKMATFKSSRPAVLELAAHYREIVGRVRRGGTDAIVAGDTDGDEAARLVFVEMAEVCLWGNATDLSLLTNLTYEDIQKLQGSEARKRAEKNVLVNDLDRVFGVLNGLKKTRPRERRRVDIVLDNAGFELFVDLVLAGYLVATGLATEVVLHPKDIPWFVSDVVPRDFSDLLGAMSDPRGFYEKEEEGRDGGRKEVVPLSDKEVEDVEFLFRHWSELHAEGQLVLRPNAFWTHAGAFWRMPKVAPQLFEDLKESEAVIFKGDLNYRKLIGDGEWDPTTPFQEAIGPLGKGSGLRVLALRTCKGDCVVGLPPGKDEEIRATEGGGGDSGARKWAWGGKWAVVEFSDGKL